MKDWITPTLGALVCWGIWGFVPKITTKYIDPKSAIVYESIGSLILAIIILFSVQFQVTIHPRGIALAITTGLLGFLGAFCFINAVSKGPVTLVSALSALYPIVSVFLALFFLHETLTLKQVIGIGLSVLAIILVTA